MTNQFYNASGVPAAQTRGVSATQRTEFTAIETGFSKLPSLNNLYASAENYAVDTGVVNALVVALNANLSALFDGMEVVVKVLVTTTGQATIAVTGTSAFGAKNVFRSDGSATAAGDLLAGQFVAMRYNGTTGAFQLLNTISTSPTSGLPTTGGTMTGQLRFAKGAAVVAAATVNLDAATGNDFHMTGNTTITAFTIAAGQLLKVIVDGTPLITYNATSLKVPGQANIQAAAGDTFWIMGDGAGNAIITDYAKADGSQIKGTGALLAVLTPTAAANIDFLSIFTSAYDNYVIMGSGISNSAAQILQMRLAVAGAADAGSNYYLQPNYSITLATTSATSIAITGTAGPLVAGVGTDFEIRIKNVNDTTRIKHVMSEAGLQIDAVPSYLSVIQQNLYVAANAVTGFRLLWSGGGNFGATGKVRVYGYNNT